MKNTSGSVMEVSLEKIKIFSEGESKWYGLCHPLSLSVLQNLHLNLYYSLKVLFQ